MKMSLCFLTLSVFASLVQCTYFTMSDVEVNIPGNRSKLLPGNHAIATMYALQSNETEIVRYSIINVGERYLQIFPSTGDIMFGHNFLDETSKNITTISVQVFAEETRGMDNTTFQVNISPPDVLDCDLITQDLCYWQSATYRIFENRKPTTIGSLSSPYLIEMCEGFKINYTLKTGSENFTLIPPTDTNKSWGIGTKRPLERDVRRVDPDYFHGNLSGESINITVECSVEDPEGTRRDVPKELTIGVMDEDDNPPIPQEKNETVYLNGKRIIKGEIDMKKLIFTDRDSFAVNHYTIRITKDKFNILKENCTVQPLHRYADEQTIIICQLYFTKNAPLPISPYKAILQINDTSMRPQFGKSVAKLPIYIYPGNSRTSEALGLTKSATVNSRPLILYPSSTVQVFKTAGPFARVTQPNKNLMVNVTNFKILNKTLIFKITDDEGIVYVSDIAKLRESPSNVKLSIQWKKNDTLQVDEIDIHMITEPTHTCQNMSTSILDWAFCSSFISPAKCERACGISTGGSRHVEERKDGNMKRCMWRGLKRPSGVVTPLYSTCTPDTETCPDNICDSLEQLNDLICPQDCTKYSFFPTTVNERTGRGIAHAAGVCSCSSGSHCTCSIPTNTVTSSTQPPLNLTNSIPPLHLGRHTGNELATCGTTCMLGIAAGIVFLLGAVAVVVACWRLDRVQKAVRGKFSDDAPDLSAPLSDYVDRGVLPDNLHLNFDMTTALNLQAKHFAPDPKWEFPRSQLIVEQTLGEGEFGRVLRARAKDIAGQPGYTTVAVKTLKEDAREGELADLLSEYELLKEVSHPNVIRLLGASTSPGGPVYLIIEFAQYGSLRSYLRRSRHLKSECPPPSTGSFVDSDNQQYYDHPNTAKVTPKDILSFAWQISNGMSYLNDIKLVHRDLAARNVLLGSGRICKISDFGLTRDVYEDNAYFKRSKGRVPVKWMAPESLSDHLYTSKSDVWSFGVLIWELITLGATPYPGIQVQNLFHLLKQGYRMERPENCSTALYKVMRGCWHMDPNQRPEFSSLAIKFEKMLSDGIEYLELITNVIHNRSYFCMNYEDGEEDIETTNNNKSQGGSVNYLEKLQQYVKCGDSDKLQEPVMESTEENVVAVEDEELNTNNVVTQEYETPVKISNKSERAKTPTNECPHYYTDMGARKSK